MTTPVTVKQTDSDKVINGLIYLCTFFALLVLVIDWKIKNDIVRAARQVRSDIDAFERKYYGRKDFEDRLRSYSDGPSGTGSGMDGNAGVEAGANSAKGKRPSKEARPVVRVVPGSGSGSVQVPEDD